MSEEQKEDIEDPDDEEMVETPKDVISTLGFDPAKEEVEK
jgi:hypothetical protein